MCEKHHLLTIVLDDETMARLGSVADIAGLPEKIVASSIIRDVLDDDFLAHHPEVQAARRQGNTSLQ